MDAIGIMLSIMEEQAYLTDKPPLFILVHACHFGEVNTVRIACRQPMPSGDRLPA